MYVKEEIEKLLGVNPLAEFNRGTACALTNGRNRNVGAMFFSEYASEYIQILYRMLLFRREYEQEPLYDNIFNAVILAIESGREDNKKYSRDEFDRQMTQLHNWKLVERRLEKERLRGYKDSRRDRYRFKLTDDTIAFLIWLEERLQADFMPAPDDTENLLEFVLSRLKDIGSDLKKLDNALGEDAEEKAEKYSSRVIFYLHNADEGTAKISGRLSEFSATLGDFLLENYNFDRAKEIVSELGKYLESYLRRVSLLRRKINAELEKLESTDIRNSLITCLKIYESQLDKIPSFIGRGKRLEEPQMVISRLGNYYRRQGNIDVLCGRVNDAAIKVLGKFSAYLQEVERKANRLEFLNRRLQELASLPPETEPVDFLFDLLRPAFVPLDPNYGDAFIKAEPPMPRYSEKQKRQAPRVHIKKRRHDGKIPQTLDEVKLHGLRHWLQNKYPAMSNGDLRGIEDAQYNGIEDFCSFMQLAKYGLLGNGKTLKKIGYALRFEKDGEIASLEDKKHYLEIPAILLEKQKK